MQPQHQPRLSDDERINLVAFLDGELAEADAIKLEDKVARSVSVRREIQALEKTWNMLDWLPRLELPEEFASQTVTRIHTQQLRAEMIEGRLKRFTIIAGKIVGWAACVLAAAGVGFAAIRLAWPDPTRELINDLEIVENLDSYRAIPDIEFLDSLAKLGAFSEPAAGPAPGAAPNETAPDENPPAEKPPDQNASEPKAP